MARTRMAIATPSSTSSASLYSEDLAVKSGTREELLDCDWLASAETALACSMIYSQETQINTTLVMMD